MNAPSFRLLWAIQPDESCASYSHHVLPEYHFLCFPTAALLADVFWFSASRHCSWRGTHRTLSLNGTWAAAWGCACEAPSPGAPAALTSTDLPRPEGSRAPGTPWPHRGAAVHLSTPLGCSVPAVSLPPVTRTLPSPARVGLPSHTVSLSYSQEGLLPQEQEDRSRVPAPSNQDPPASWVRAQSAEPERMGLNSASTFADGEIWGSRGSVSSSVTQCLPPSSAVRVKRVSKCNTLHTHTHTVCVCASGYYPEPMI